MDTFPLTNNNDRDWLAGVVAIARKTAWGAAAILRSYYRGEPNYDLLQVQEKNEGPVTAADLAVNQYILNNFQAAFGTTEFAYLTEETYKEQTNTPTQPWVWIIDPLDGTRDFIDKTGEYAIHIALVYEHRPVIAVVALPESETIYFAYLGGGTLRETLDGSLTPVRVSDRSTIPELALVASRTHRDDRFNQLLSQIPFKSQKYVGSVGCKIVTILEQQTDVYISLSGKSAPKDWDMAAPELILTEAGGKFTAANGDSLKYNTGDVSQWGCLIASNGIAHVPLCQQVTAALAEIDRI
jgi:3'(2'), 5'-bisphosphate nucleotidase